MACGLAARVNADKMHANSSPVRTAQSAPHPRLREVVLRHIGAPYLRRPGASGREAFASIAEQLASAAFILDAGCGTGASTFALAREYPQRLVVGVDKSAARLGIGQRLASSGTTPSNAILLRCELVDFWQLAAAAGLRCERQFLLYPNPWPKPDQFKRRWHGHPVLPAILALGGVIELRTNWRIYAEEFAGALKLAGWSACCEAFAVGVPLTPFERKYVQSEHTLWRCIATPVPR